MIINFIMELCYPSVITVNVSYPLNRMVEGHLQDFSTLATYLKKFKDDQFFEGMSDFHVLVYIATMDMLPLRV